MYQVQQTNKGERLSLQSLLAAMIPGGAYHNSGHHLFLFTYLLTLFTNLPMCTPPLAAPSQ